MTARLACVHLLVRDMERAIHFYTRTLGLRVQHQQPGACYLGAGDGHHELALFEYAPEGIAPPLAIGCRSIGFRLPSRAALAEICERLPGARATALDNGVTWSIHVTDPDGTRLELFCDAARAGARRRGPHIVARALSSADLRAARDEERV